MSLPGHPNIEIIVTPNEHYEVVSVTVDATTNENLVAVPGQRSGHAWTVVIPEAQGDAEYTVEVEFRAIQYRVVVEYYDDEGRLIDPVAEGFSYSANNSGIITVGDWITLQNDYQPDDHRFANARMIPASGAALNLGTSDRITRPFTSAELTRFRIWRDTEYTVTIRAIYCKIFTIELNKPAEVADGSITIVAVSTLAGAQTFDGGNSTFTVDRGTILMIESSDCGTWLFKGFTIDGISIDGNYSGPITADASIEFIFQEEIYAIEIRGMVNGRSEALGSAASVIITDSTGEVTRTNLSQIRRGDVIQSISFDNEVLARFAFSGFSMERNLPFSTSSESFTLGNETITPDSAWHENLDSELIDGKRVSMLGIEICDRFVENFVVTRQGVLNIVITVNLIAKYTVNVNIIPFVENDVNSYDIFVVEGDVDLPVGKEDYFIPGTTIKIVARPSDFSTFQRFDPNTVSVSAGDVVNITDRSITITLGEANRTINLEFEARPFALTTNNSRSSFTLGEQEAFKVGDNLVISFDVPSNHNITKWTINGEDFTGHVSGNTLTIRLTGEFLEQHGWIKNGELEINYKVFTKLKTEVLMTYLIPSIIIPLILAVLLALWLVNAKRKSLIRKQLMGARAEKMKRDVGGFISDLRDGTISGDISAKDVKQAMKDQKGK
jgi:hypothetical protein